jgi:RNA polymerase sigma-70 factor (ECF subfamily)
MTHEEFEAAYSDNFTLTRRFLLSRGIGAARAEELAQAAWAKAWERREQLRELASAAAWVNTIAFNMLRGAARKAVPLVQIDDRDEPVRLSVDEKVDAERLLAALSERDRQLMLLHVVAGLTSSEIATGEPKLSAVAVRVRLHRAKAHLRKRFSAAPLEPRTIRSHRRRAHRAGA